MLTRGRKEVEASYTKVGRGDGVSEGPHKMCTAVLSVRAIWILIPHITLNATIRGGFSVFVGGRRSPVEKQLSKYNKTEYNQLPL